MTPHLFSRERTRAGVLKYMPKCLRDLYSIIDGKGLTYHKISEIAGISRHNLSNWATGTSSPTLNTFCALVEALGYELVLRPKTPIEKARKEYVEFVPPDPGRDCDPAE